MAPITFNFLSNKSYPQLKRLGAEVGNSLGYDLSVKYGKIAVNQMPKFVKGLGACVGVALFADKYKFVAHSAPEMDNNPNFISNFISETIDKIRTKGHCKDEDVSAVIYGGIAYDSTNPISEKSCELVDAIEEGCKLEGIEPTIITGQYSNGLNTRIDSYIGQNQIIVWGKLIDKIKATQNVTSQEIVKILEEIFEYVKIAQDTKLKVIKDLSYKTEHMLKQKV